MRVNVNIPEKLLRQIDCKAEELSLSRSAFIAMACSEKLSNIRRENNPLLDKFLYELSKIDSDVLVQLLSSFPSDKKE